MTILDFYGQKLRIKDISSVITRKAKLSSTADLIGNIIGFLFFIVVVIALYIMYRSHDITTDDAVSYGILTVIGIAGIQMLREKVFNKTYIVEIRMRSGDSHKSHKMNRDEAIDKKMVILDEIK